MKTTLSALLALAMFAGPVVSQEPYEGETLISLLTSNDTYSIDLDHNILRTWHGDAVPATFAYLRADGSIVRPCLDTGGHFGGGGTGGRIQIIDSNDVVIWDYLFSTYDYQQHHDIEPMPNGNVLVIAWERKTYEEAIAAGRQQLSGEMWVTMIAEIEPVGATGGNIVWEWHLWDHLIQDADPSKDNYGVVTDHPELVDINYGPISSADWDHANSVDYNPQLDQVIFSARKTNEFYIIDHSTTTEEAAGHTGGNSGMGGDILYRWGNPQVYDRGDETDQYYFGIHAAGWIDTGLPGAGRILTFNNGNRAGTVNDYSSVEEIDPPVDAGGNYSITPGEPFEPTAPSWVYSDAPSFYSQNRAGAFRMPNGNTLITDTQHRNIFEVTSDGTKVWTYLPSAAVHRAPRYWYDLTGVEESPPLSARLEQNFPNPFNPTTRIVFEIDRPSMVKLKIYDVSGTLVRTLVEETRHAHRYDEIWDGRDSRNRRVASGIYFCRLEAAGSVHTKKMVLLK
ncbi:MAG: aryl-sulfate sulfotransferase [Candidatus Latescibacterota bacterium]|nr:MAG: aryl-sulfate sulfotransferase [Candidatus Latescibacterota bacterium]